MTSAFWTQLAEEQTILTVEEKTSGRNNTSIIALKFVSIQCFFNNGSIGLIYTAETISVQLGLSPWLSNL